MLFKCECCGKRYWKPSRRRACWKADTLANLAEGRAAGPFLTRLEAHVRTRTQHVHLTETGTTDVMAALLRAPPEEFARQELSSHCEISSRPLPDRSHGESESRWRTERSHASDVDSTDSRDSDSCSLSSDSSSGDD